MLNPDTVRPEIMSAVANGLAGRPEQIRQAYRTEDGDEQEKYTPRRTL